MIPVTYNASLLFQLTGAPALADAALDVAHAGRVRQLIFYLASNYLPVGAARRRR